jgi:predicted GH43/DUF377 family glycosyl hydrolase
MERRALFPCLARVPHFAFSLVAGQGAPPTKKLRPIKPLLGLLMLLCGCGTRHDILHENGSTIRSSSDGLYYWYYHAWKGHYHIEVSSSTSPTGPWTQYPTPILEPDSETFDSQSVACPTVVQEEGTFYMLYSGEGDAGWSIGLAVADDPLGPWRKVSELIPNFGYVTSVSHHDGRYFMYAESAQQNDYGPTVVATSFSLLGPWTIEGVALPDSVEQWESAGTEGGTVLQINNRYVLFYTGGYYIDDIRLHAHDAVGVAFSTDGLHFARSLLNPIVSDPSLSIGNVSALREGGEIYLFYTHRVDDGTGASESLGETVLNVGDIPRK